jgi:hypothetical protein
MRTAEYYFVCGKREHFEPIYLKRSFKLSKQHISVSRRRSRYALKTFGNLFNVNEHVGGNMVTRQHAYVIQTRVATVSIFLSAF